MGEDLRRGYCVPLRRAPWTVRPRQSDGSDELGERRSKSSGGQGVQPEVVVAPAQVLYEGVPGEDDLGGDG